MPEVTRATTVVQTVAGEVTVNINLTITIDKEGKISVEAGEKDIPDYIPEMPDWEPGVLNNFGKEV